MKGPSTLRLKFGSPTSIPGLLLLRHNMNVYAASFIGRISALRRSAHSGPHCARFLSPSPLSSLSSPLSSLSSKLAPLPSELALLSRSSYSDFSSSSCEAEGPPSIAITGPAGVASPEPYSAGSFVCAASVCETFSLPILRPVWCSGIVGRNQKVVVICGGVRTEKIGSVLHGVYCEQQQVPILAVNLPRLFPEKSQELSCAKH